MTGDCHVRFCERLRGETPLCLLGETKYFYFFSKKEAHAKLQSRQGFNSFRFPAAVRLCEITKKIPFKISSEGDSRWAHLESNQAPTAPKDRGSQLLTF
jgi:hypothetical protein